MRERIQHVSRAFTRVLMTEIFLSRVFACRSEASDRIIFRRWYWVLRVRGSSFTSKNKENFIEMWISIHSRRAYPLFGFVNHCREIEICIYFCKNLYRNYFIFFDLLTFSFMYIQFYNYIAPTVVLNYYYIIICNYYRENNS